MISRKECLDCPIRTSHLTNNRKVEQTLNVICVLFIKDSSSHAVQWHFKVSFTSGIWAVIKTLLIITGI